MKQLAIFRFSPCRSIECWTAGCRTGLHLSFFTAEAVLNAVKTFVFSTLLEWVISFCRRMQHQWCARQVHAFQVWYFLSFDGRWWGSIHSAGDYWQPFIGLNWLPRALSLITNHAWLCGCIFLLTSSPLGPYLMRAPSLGQVWVLRVPR